MKKVLFATTALVATAGVAAADVTFGGYGRFGVLYTDPAAGNSPTNVTSRFRLQVDATAESDAGVTFGAGIRIEVEERDDAVGAVDQVNGARFFARSGGLEVGVGNIFGAIASMPGQYPIDLGLTGLSYSYTAAAVGGGYFDEYSSGGTGRAGNNGVEVLYSVGDFSAHLSASDFNDRVAAYLAYTFNGITLAFGYQDSNVAADVEYTLSVGGSFGVADVSLTYAENNAGADRIVLGGLFEVGAATTIEAYVAQDDSQVEDTAYGIGFNHNLGGGVSLQGGIDNALDGATYADLGVRFNF